METEKSVTLRDILRMFFFHKVFFVVFPLVLAGSAYIGTQLKTPEYEASVKMFIKAEKTTAAVFYRGINTGDPVADHSELLKSNAVLNRVIHALKLDKRPLDYEKQYASPLKKILIEKRLEKAGLQSNAVSDYNSALASLSSSISVIPIGQSRLFFISVTDFDPSLAVRIANSVSRSYIIFDLEQNIEELNLRYGEKHSVVLQLKGYISDYEKTLHGELIPDTDAIGPASVKIVAQAEGAALKKGVSKSILILFSLFAGIVLAIIFAIILEYYDTTFKTPQKVMEHSGLPLIGSLPRRKSNNKFLISELTGEGDTGYMKSLQILSEQLPLLMNDKNVRTISITDTEGSQETAIININIGTYLAHNTGIRVLLIDADFRNASLSETLNVPNDAGLADVLASEASIVDTIQNLGNNLYILPSGKTVSHPGIILNSSEMSRVLKQVKDAYELILINCPDVKSFTDTVILSKITDGTILVLNAGKVKKQVFDIAIGPLKQKEINIIGIILNNYEYVIPEAIYQLT